MADVKFTYSGDGTVPVTANTGHIVFVKGTQGATYTDNTIVLKTSNGNEVFAHGSAKLEWEGNI